MEFWDFDENKNYVILKYKNYSFKVLNKKNKNQAVNLLYIIQQIINAIAEEVENNYKFLKPPLKDMATIFLCIHPNYYFVHEMQKDQIFEGLNKPKNVRINSYLPAVGKDGLLKAEYRSIFFKLRDDKNNLKTINELLPLVIHEIAHTGCNHVRWRDDDHGADFKLFEKFLYFCWSSILDKIKY